MTYKLFLDDFRTPRSAGKYMKYPIYFLDDWVIVRTYNEFINCLVANGLPETVSFDHDLADEHYDPDLYGSETYNEVYDNFVEKTGYDCAKYLINYCIDNKKELPETILIHSMNTVGTQNIKSLFDSYIKSINIK